MRSQVTLGLAAVVLASAAGASPPPGQAGEEQTRARVAELVHVLAHPGMSGPAQKARAELMSMGCSATGPLLATFREDTTEKARREIVRLLSGLGTCGREAIVGLGESGLPSLAAEVVESADGLAFRNAIIAEVVAQGRTVNLDALPVRRGDQDLDPMVVAAGRQVGRPLVEYLMRAEAAIRDSAPGPLARCQPPRPSTLKALGALGDPSAASFVVEALIVRDRSGCPSYSPAPDRLTARSVLVDLGPGAIPALVQAFWDEPSSRRDVAFALCALGQPGSDALNRLGPGAIEPLTEVLIEVSQLDRQRPPAATDGVRHNALAALHHLGPAASRGIEPHLAEPDPIKRCHVAAILGELGAPSGVDELLAELGEQRGWVRVCAIHALGRIKDPRALVPLIGILVENTGGAAAEARGALGAYSDRAVPALVQRFSEAAEAKTGKGEGPRIELACALALAGAAGRDALVRLGTAAEVPLFACYRRCDAPEVVAAVQAVAPEKAIADLAAWLAQGKYDNDTRAAWRLARLEDARAFAPLARVLQECPRHGDGAFEIAAETLPRLDHERGLAVLFAALRDGRCPWGPARIATALGNLGDPRAIEPLAELSGRWRDAPGRWEATFALEKFDDPRARAAVRSFRTRPMRVWTCVFGVVPFVLGMAFKAARAPSPALRRRWTWGLQVTAALSTVVFLPPLIFFHGPELEQTYLAALLLGFPIVLFAVAALLGAVIARRDRELGRRLFESVKWCPVTVWAAQVAWNVVVYALALAALAGGWSWK